MATVFDQPPEVTKFHEQWELETHGHEVTVNIQTNQIVNIDKLYGPLCAEGVRIFLEHNNDVFDWVVQRQNVETSEWEEKARWCCQESYSEEDR